MRRPVSPKVMTCCLMSCTPTVRRLYHGNLILCNPTVKTSLPWKPDVMHPSSQTSLPWKPDVMHPNSQTSLPCKPDVMHPNSQTFLPWKLDVLFEFFVYILLTLRSAVCSPLLVKYRAIEMTALLFCFCRFFVLFFIIIIFYSFSTQPKRCASLQLQPLSVPAPCLLASDA